MDEIVTMVITNKLSDFQVTILRAIHKNNDISDFRLKQELQINGSNVLDFDYSVKVLEDNKYIRSLGKIVKSPPGVRPYNYLITTDGIAYLHALDIDK